MKVNAREPADATTRAHERAQESLQTERRQPIAVIDN